MYLVTGGSSGIGRATAKALIERERKVTVVARRLDRLQELVELGPDLVHAIPADLATAQGRAAVVAALEEHSAIAGVVHAAGSQIAPRGYSDLDPDALAADMTIHVGAPIALTAALQSRLVGSRVVFIDSYSATNLRQGWSGYSIVKAAAQMAARAAAAELDRISVIRLFPGGVRTELVEAVLDSGVDAPAVQAFRAMDARGELSPPGPVGKFITNVLLDVTDAQLEAHDILDFSDPAHRAIAVDRSATQRS